MDRQMDIYDLLYLYRSICPGIIQAILLYLRTKISNLLQVNICASSDKFLRLSHRAILLSCILTLSRL